MLRVGPLVDGRWYLSTQSHHKTLPIFRFSRVSSSPSFNRPDYMVADGGAEKRLTGPRCYPVGIHDGVGESDVVVVSSSFPISYSSRRNRPEVP